MDIRFLIEQLDEITRRGFLTGLAGAGAACGLGGCGIIDDVREGKERFTRIREGMTKEEVHAIMKGRELGLGPKITKEGPGREEWEYNGVGTLWFYNDRVIFVKYVNAPLNKYEGQDLEETSDEAIARIVELSKNRK